MPRLFENHPDFRVSNCRNLVSRSFPWASTTITLLLLLGVLNFCILSVKFLPLISSTMIFVYALIVVSLELRYCLNFVNSCRNDNQFPTISYTHRLRSLIYTMMGASLIFIAVYTSDRNLAVWLFAYFLLLIAFVFLASSCTVGRIVPNDAKGIEESLDMPVDGTGRTDTLWIWFTIEWFLFLK